MLSDRSREQHNQAQNHLKHNVLLLRCCKTNENTMCFNDFLHFPIEKQRREQHSQAQNQLKHGVCFNTFLVRENL